MGVMNLPEKIARLLIANAKTLSTAESCSGGLLSHRLTNIPGSSRFFKAGVIVYANEAKQELLNIPRTTLKKYGAVSAPTAQAMAINARKTLKTDFSVSITGIAGPRGATKTKPVGLVFIAASSKDKILCQKFLFKGNRLAIKTKASSAALRLLLRIILPK